jgi:hypothetical protein
VWVDVLGDGFRARCGSAVLAGYVGQGAVRGEEGSVRSGNSFPGLRSGADGALCCAASQREIAESLGGCSSAEVMLDSRST